MNSYFADAMHAPTECLHQAHRDLLKCFETLPQKTFQVDSTKGFFVTLVS